MLLLMHSVEFLVVRHLICCICVVVIVPWVLNTLMILYSFKVLIVVYRVSLLFMKMILLLKLWFWNNSSVNKRGFRV